MSNVVQPGILETPKRRRGFKPLDIIIFVIIIAVISALAVTLFRKVRLQHEVTAAQAVSDQVIKDIASQNAANAHALGNTSFQAKHSTVQLQDLFASARNLTRVNPSVDRKIVSNTAQAQIVYFIYKYPGSDQYFVRVTTAKLAGTNNWRLAGISGNNTESSLIVQ